jgi:hypothetical protein
LDYSIGLTTDPNSSLDLTPFEISAPLSIEWYGSLDAISEDWQKINIHFINSPTFFYSYIK